MASMREIFPLHVYSKKSQKNFIKENIRNVRGYSQCNAAQKQIAKRSPDQYGLRKALSVSSKYSLTNDKKSSTTKCNNNLQLPKCSSEVSKQYSNSENNLLVLTRGCQTEIRTVDKHHLPMRISCRNCGYPNARLKMTNNIESRKNEVEDILSAKSPEGDVKLNQCLKLPEDRLKMKDSHRISHENEECPKKETIPPSYKIGEVPKYLQERNAKLLRDRQRKASQEKLEELMGLNDPKCPPGHMLMPFEDMQRNIDEMESRFNNLVQELNRMPVSNDSYKMRQKNIKIEKELKYLEDKLDMFKTKKVFVEIPQ